MSDGSLHPEDAVRLIQELNASGQFGRRGGSRPSFDPTPPPPPGPPVEEPPLPDSILDEIDAGRRAMGLEPLPRSEPQAEETQSAPPMPVARRATTPPSGPSGLTVPVALAMDDTKLITSTGDIELTAGEQKAFRYLCIRIIKRRIKQTLAKIEGKP